MLACDHVTILQKCCIDFFPGERRSEATKHGALGVFRPQTMAKQSILRLPYYVKDSTL